MANRYLCHRLLPPPVKCAQMRFPPQPGCNRTPQKFAGSESGGFDAAAVRAPGNSVFFLGLLVFGPGSLLVFRRDCVRVQISAGQNDSDAQVFALDLAVKRGGGGYGAGRLDGACADVR